MAQCHITVTTYSLIVSMSLRSEVTKKPHEQLANKKQWSPLNVRLGSCVNVVLVQRECEAAC